MHAHDTALEAQAAAELRALAERHEQIALVIQPGDALILLAQVQLALHHPTNVGASAIRARALGRMLERLLGLVAGPAVQEFARRGWEATYDVPAGTQEPT